MNTQISTPSSPLVITAATSPSVESLRQRLRRLNLYGLATHAEEIIAEPWLARVLEVEDCERQRRSLKRRTDNARLGAFKPLADFDYAWPKEIDRALLEELFTFAFLEQAANIVIVGPNGLGKTMIAKNLLHQAVLRGYTARFTLASDMLHDLAAQDSSTALSRRLRRYTTPALLCIDEVGYLSYDARYADLLFEVITRRYQQRATVLTTNKSFGEWNEVFPNAACVVTLVDRLVHRSEILAIPTEGSPGAGRAALCQTCHQQESALNRPERMATMEPNDLPIVCLPLDLSDASAASLIEFLQNLIEALERHYAGQLMRHDRQHASPAPVPKPVDASDVDPPF